jgi:hypothetical protein
VIPTAGAHPEDGGLASGLVNTTYQVGSAIGLAAMVAIALRRGTRAPSGLTGQVIEMIRVARERRGASDRNLVDRGPNRSVL